MELIRRSFLGFLLLCWAPLSLDEAAAQWVDNPAINTPVSIALWAQQSPAMVSDGAGGAIIVWSDGNPMP